MNEEESLIKLIAKYNAVLQESMRNAVAEDLVNLIIVNHDDKDFELKDLIAKKAKFKNFVFKEFMRLNSTPITGELKHMNEIGLKLQKAKQTRIKL